MPDDVNRKFTPIQTVKETEQPAPAFPATVEEYQRQIREMKARLDNQPGWRGRELRRRLAHDC